MTTASHRRARRGQPHAPALSLRALAQRRRNSQRPLATLLACAVALLLALILVATASAATLPAPPHLTAPAGAVFEASTGEPLYGVDAGERRLIASTTKMMTALVVMDELSLQRVCTATDYVPSPGESQVGLHPGERMTVKDLLRGLMLPSGNDAAEALAVCASGTRTAFIAAMNAKARALRLDNTHFETPVGLDTPGNYSTAADLARLGIAVRRDRFLAQTVDLRSAQLTSGAVPRTVVNRNTLVQEFPWVDGVKSGHTNAAGYLLVASGTRHGVTYVASVMGEPNEGTRDADALALLRWAFATHTFKTPVRSRAVYATATVKYRSEDEIQLIATRSVRELVRRDERIAVAVRAPRELQGPLPKNAVVGSLTVRVAGRVAATVPLVTRTAVPEVGLFTRAADAVARPGSLIAIVVVLGGLATLLLLRRRHETRRSRRRADMEAA